MTDVAGLDYDPFTRITRLTDDARVNYLMRLRKEAATR
jgi:2-polyprenyl-3-methyl-5-hydroxy-6-metoxy-1,4-benzoquinol methylase